jgi:subtilase family serine protease
VTGSVGLIENAFGVHLHQYRAQDGSSFYAPDAEPSVPQAIAPSLFGLENLSNADRSRSCAILRSALSSRSGGGGNGNGINPADIGIWDLPGMPAGEVRKAYSLYTQDPNDGQMVLGQGQRVALVELGGFDQNDINYYIWYNANIAQPTLQLNTVPIQTHLMAGYQGGTNRDTGEVELDIELLEAVSDGLAAIDVYEEDSNGSVLDEVNQILNDDTANQVSISYDYDEDFSGASGMASSYNAATEEMALQGQAVFVASGDWGAYGVNQSNLTVNLYAASPYVTGVGGTTLWINQDIFGDYGAFWYEHTWNETAFAGGATGGGFSAFTAIPDYQSTYLNTYSFFESLTSPASVTMRNVPDVALNSDPYTPYYTHTNGIDTPMGGTSAATPIWAALWARQNGFRAKYGLPEIGYANRVLYSIAEGGLYNTDFHDVYGGYNNGYFMDTPGYDCTTGLGSMEGTNLLNEVVQYGNWSPVETLSIPQTSVISGQQVTLSAHLGTISSNGGYAVVTYAIVSGGVYYQLGQDTVTAGRNIDNFSTTAPDVQQNTTQSYICYVIYYSAAGKAINGPNWSNQASVAIQGNSVANVAITPNTAYEGQTVTGTVVLKAPAAQNEQIDLSSSDPAHAGVPGSVIIPAGFSFMNFSITTKAVPNPETITIQAVSDPSSGLISSQSQGSFTVAPLMTALTINPTSVAGGTGATGTVTFAQAAPTNFTLVLSSDNAAAGVASSLNVKVGQTSVTFPITTQAVRSDTTATIAVKDAQTARYATLTIHAPGVKALAVSPTSAVGPTTVTGAVSINSKAPTGGLTLRLSSSNPAVASVPASVVVAKNGTSAKFQVSLAKVQKTTRVTLTATDSSGDSKTAIVTVKP